MAFCSSTGLRLLVASCSLVGALRSSAQGTPAWQWVQAGASAGASGGRSVTVAASGNVFVTGYFTRSLTLGTTTLTTDSTDAFVAKYAANGQVLWAQKFGSSRQGVGYQVVADAADNCYVAGVFRGTVQLGPMTLTSQSDGDEFLVKYSAQGLPLWAQRTNDLAPNYHGPLRGGLSFPLYPSRNVHLALDAQGNLYTASEFVGTITRGTTTFTALGTSSDALVVKYSAQGQVQWARQGGGTGTDYAADVAVDAAGNVYVVGGYNATATFDSVVFPSLSSSLSDNYNTYVLKYDAQGQVLWGRATVPASFRDYAILTAVGVDAAGNAYVLGDFAPEVTLGATNLSLPPASSAHVFMAKYDPQGTVLWARMAGSAPPNTILVSNGHGLAVQADGTATITGIYSQSMTFAQLTLGTPGGANQTYVARYNPQGVVLWAGRAGTQLAGLASNVNSGYGVSSDEQGVSYVTGDFGGQADFGPFTLTNSTPTDANVFVGKIGAVALSTRAVVPTSLRVYPTLVTGTGVTVDLPDPTPGATGVRLVNAVGQVVRQQTLPPATSQYTLDTQGLPAGLYWLQATSTTGRQTSPVVIP